MYKLLSDELSNDQHNERVPIIEAVKSAVSREPLLRYICLKRSFSQNDVDAGDGESITHPSEWDKSMRIVVLQPLIEAITAIKSLMDTHKK